MPQIGFATAQIVNSTQPLQNDGIWQSIWTGTLGSLIAAFIVGLLLNELFYRSRIRLVLMLFKYIPSWLGAKLKGKWEFKWSVANSTSYPSKNSWDLELVQYFNKVSGLIRAKDEIYFIRGTISSNNLLTGEWKSPDTYGYHGVFQAIIRPNGKKLEGLWIGFSKEGVVKSGNLLFRRK